MAKKAREAFRTISEVANWLDIPAHVLRFWESKFSQIKPVKRAGGRRYYRPSDMELIGGIKKLLHDDGLTIRGVQKMLKEEGVKTVSALSLPLDMPSEEEAAARRVARRARRKPRSTTKSTKPPASKTSTATVPADPPASDASVEETPTAATPTEAEPVAEAEEAPFAHVEDDDPVGGDNVVSLSGREQGSRLHLGASAEPEPAANEPTEEEQPEDAAPEPEEVAETPEAAPEPVAATQSDATSDAARENAAQGYQPSEAQEAGAEGLKALRRMDVDTTREEGDLDAIANAYARLQSLRARMATDPTAR